MRSPTRRKRAAQVRPTRSTFHIGLIHSKDAKTACVNWHYSKCLPAGKLICFGVWEEALFVGVVIFGRGANRNIGKPFHLKQSEVCELVRVALRERSTPTSRIVSLSLKLLHKTNPGLRLVISYADPEQGHLGIIYQATNWMFIGTSQPQPAVIVDGCVKHKRTISSRHGTVRGYKKSKILWKYKYAYPLDSDIRSRLVLITKPYPRHGDSL